MEYHKENWTVNYNSQTVKIRKLYHNHCQLSFVKYKDIHMIYILFFIKYCKYACALWNNIKEIGLLTTTIRLLKYVNHIKIIVK